MKKGICTVLFNAFLCDKLATMTLQGGNTEEVYKNGKDRILYVKSLIKQHPDVVKMTTKYGRPHHLVNYSVFKQIQPVRRPGVMAKGVNNFGMVLTES